LDTYLRRIDTSKRGIERFTGRPYPAGVKLSLPNDNGSSQRSECHDPINFNSFLG
jgi:hypothetical protein